MTDKEMVLNWMTHHCLGFRNARTRENILPFVGNLTDRGLRKIMSELIHEGNVCSSHKRGYWAVPLQTTDTEEIEAMKQCYIERKSKALDLIQDCDRLIDKAEDMLLKVRQGQGELVFG